MKKLFIFINVFLAFSTSCFADHITGGEMFYTSNGLINGSYQYSVTLKLFMRCNSGRQFVNPTTISVFNRATGARVMDVTTPLRDIETISLSDSDPCITNPPQVCYQVGYYSVNISLPPSSDGYILASQVNFRISGISNLSQGYNNVGATYTAEIPGNFVTNAPLNNSAKFTGSDLVIVCANNRFSYSFGAEDPDSDQLRYYFCNAYQSGITAGGNNNIPPPSPPYNSVPYDNYFLGNAPLGPEVQINPSTGLITGIAPAAGVYVVTVCVDEIRNGRVIAVQRKDLQINIAPCEIAGAILQPEYLVCGSSSAVQIENLSTSPLINTNLWQLTNRAGAEVYTSTTPVLNYNFGDTGLYQVKLVINRGQQCTDSTTAVIRVYPGLLANFGYAGKCFSKPTVFKDRSTNVYGKINDWTWSFSEAVSPDVAKQQNPTYTFQSMGNKLVSLLVTTEFGCRDIVTQTISVLDKPAVDLLFKDTLICKSDSVQLIAQGGGVYQWSPQQSMLLAQNSRPVVAPHQTTTYYIEMNDNGCVNRDSVRVRVTDKVDLQVMNDTTICSGDSIIISIHSDAFRYSWRPAEQTLNATIKNPTVFASSNTTFYVTANIGSCIATQPVIVTTAPYPKVDAGNDTVICYNAQTRLYGITDGASIMWAPLAHLSSPTQLQPIARPLQTTTYMLTVTGNNGCPKPAYDTVRVRVMPQIKASAGNDTTIVINQPLQLLATGGVQYTWAPATFLSNTLVANPVLMVGSATEGLQYQVLVYNEAGCVDSAMLKIRVFGTVPSVFVPTGFTPNNDGVNDILKPVAAGIKRFEFFSVYNRWGQLMFRSATDGDGWNGTLNGAVQPSGTYVWMVKAIDFNDRPIFDKGTVTLIR